MPFQPIDFANIQPQGSPWMRDFVENLTTGYKAGRLPYETKQAEQKQDLANAMAQMLNQEQPQKFRSDMLNDQFTRALQGANTNKINTLLPSDLLEANLKNKWYEKVTKSQIDANEAMANWRNTGGSGGSTGSKDDNDFRRFIGLDNPQLKGDPAKIYEASNVLKAGGNQLSDGTILNPMSPNARDAYNRVTKSGDTAQGLNQRRADALLNSLLDRGDKLMPNAVQFAGLAGQANKTASQLGASLGGNDPKYLDFKLFTTQIVPQLANQMILTEGARANNTQKAMMLKVADPIYWDTNPKMAMEQWKYLTDTFRSSITSVVGQGVSEISQRARASSKNENNDPLGIR